MNTKAQKLVTLAVLTNIVSANAFFGKKEYPKIYPFVPMKTSEIYSDIEKITEDENFKKNFVEIAKAGLSRGKTKRQPWTASFWPLSKGTIADPYENSRIPYYADFLKTHHFVWKATKNSYDERKEEVLANIDSLSEEELTQLAPSEKYDLLLGDKSFSLTDVSMENMYKYGQDNRFWHYTNATVAAEDTIKMADEFWAKKQEYYARKGTAMEKRLYPTYDVIFRKHYIIKTRLESQMAVKMLDAGEVSSIKEGIRKATPIAMAEAKNYVLAERKVKNIANWEGICNGWSMAAGVIPRPRKSVSFKLPDGRNLKFYPSDIKGLVSQYWFNSKVQGTLKKDKNTGKKTGGITLVGNRCNLTKTKKDKFGRFYDHSADPKSGKHNKPRCVGVHPAKWHLGLVNLIGVQKRSFIVERKVTDPIDNHPMSAYKMSYFNPYTGRASSAMGSIVEYDKKKDQFSDYRNENTKFIVGVTNVMTYLDYAKPVRKNTDSEKDDLLVHKKMYYDLELDESYNIIGGQWRAVKVGKPAKPHDKDKNRPERKGKYTQPDFFWSVSKDWKKLGQFKNIRVRDAWTDTTQAPPASWFADYSNTGDYVGYHKKYSTYHRNGKKCKVQNKKTGEEKTVWCEFNRSRPKPFINILNVLIERSSGVKYRNY